MPAALACSAASPKLTRSWEGGAKGRGGLEGCRYGIEDAHAHPTLAATGRPRPRDTKTNSHYTHPRVVGHYQERVGWRDRVESRKDRLCRGGRKHLAADGGRQHAAPNKPRLRGLVARAAAADAGHARGVAPGVKHHLYVRVAVQSLEVGDGGDQALDGVLDQPLPGRPQHLLHRASAHCLGWAGRRMGLAASGARGWPGGLRCARRVTAVAARSASARSAGAVQRGGGLMSEWQDVPSRQLRLYF
jgi:hypothetical protein